MSASDPGAGGVPRDVPGEAVDRWVKGPPPPTDPSTLRASDADRDRYAALLREAFVEGRIDAEEHEERLGQVMRARTYADLAPVLADLPVAGPPAGPAALSLPQPAGAPVYPGAEAQPTNLVAVFSGAERKGRWVVPERVGTVAVFGGVEVDLSAAVLTSRETVVHAVAVFGGVQLTVPYGVEVRLEVVGIFGGSSGPKDADVPPPGAPVVRVTGLALFGGVDVRRAAAPPPGPALPGRA